MFARLLYSLLWHLILPLVGLRLLWRARRQPEYLQHVGERFGAAPSFGGEPVIWLHAVSVGETRATQPLVKAILARYPAHRILLTHMTPTGRATAQELYGRESRVSSCYLPYDLPWAVRRFLRRVRPNLGIVMETEVWPNLLVAAKQQGIPMVLANARLSERSARGYLRLGGLAQATFAAFSAVLAQTADHAKRLEACGAKAPQVLGNVKFDVTVDPAKLALGKEFRAMVGTRPVILAASTREGEEGPLLSAFGQHAPADALLVLVPRHPQRFDEVAALITMQGFTMARRSEGLNMLPQTQVWLGDSMGEMHAYCQMADVAVIGGCWLPLGGQSLIEACAIGIPVILGPHTFNFADAAEQAIAEGAAVRCQDLKEAMIAAWGILADAKRRKAMGEAGRAFAQASQGATERTMGVLAEFLH
ncbi:lipid IV(A) 3-deoxy-D-manno-octulosonic acid transferase [Uliginosibacterium gangwonense]|uniref:lipid IV(A) 3-deoxy-D-manno-octulosonic acid transferase n=1 Tax=Uliginosibacterium gangwonense TaxID=392736 RepID=UPI000360957A|nr:lipid IV(A) 3-deoxy-D-manno-octulosonic acid transferase [Uliginosibacterium gangwonense]